MKIYRLLGDKEWKSLCRYCIPKLGKRGFKCFSDRTFMGQMIIRFLELQNFNEEYNRLVMFEVDEKYLKYFDISSASIQGMTGTQYDLWKKYEKKIVWGTIQLLHHFL